MTSTEAATCERCGVEITESNESLSFDQICQECWEQECSDAWWEMWPVIGAIDAMIEAEWEEQGK